MGTAWSATNVIEVILSYANVYVFFLAGMIIHWLPDKFKRWYRIKFAAMPLPLVIVVIVFAVFLLYQFVSADLQAFIYFQF